MRREYRPRTPRRRTSRAAKPRYGRGGRPRRVRTGQARPAPGARSWPRGPAAALAVCSRFRLPWRRAHGRNTVAGGISIHAVDVASGRPAQGLRVEIWRIEPVAMRIAEGRLGANGQLDHPVVGGSGIEAGEYEVRFHLGEFFAGGAGASFLTV